MNKVKILIVDDEEDILEFLSYSLKNENYEVQTARNGLEALDTIKSFLPELIILDIMMPIMDGISCCVEIRKQNIYNNISIIFLTAKLDEEVQIESFETGADDYIHKPISIKVLLSRIKALLRRKSSISNPESEQELISFNNLSINPVKMEVIYNQKKLDFARKEFLLLQLLASAPGKVFRRNEILDKIWGSNIIVGDRTIDVHIRKLREKLDNLFIKTIKGVGYKFEI